MLHKDNHLFFYKYVHSTKSFRTVAEKMNFEEDIKLELLRDWNVDDPDVLFDQVHIPLGINIFNFVKAIKKDSEVSNLIKTNRDKSIKELNKITKK